MSSAASARPLPSGPGESARPGLELSRLTPRNLGGSPVACSSRQARSANAAAPNPPNMPWAARNCSRACSYPTAHGAGAGDIHGCDRPDDGGP
jgi:hypothetical protein